ncbi:unnamed protein product, partial [Candidula unifasciata]
FLLAFENSFCQDYVTEKFFRTFMDDFPVIPVVRGGTDYQRYFPQGTFVDTLDFRNPKELAAYLKKISKDHRKVATMLEAKSRYQFVAIHRHCQMCYLLHKYNITSSGIDPSVPTLDRTALTKTYTDVFRWLSQDKCYPPRDFTGALEK